MRDHPTRFPRANDVNASWLGAAVNGVKHLISEVVETCNPCNPAALDNVVLDEDLTVAVSGPALLVPGSESTISAMIAHQESDALARFLAAVPKTVNRELLACAGEPLTAEHDNDLTFILQMRAPEGSGGADFGMISTKRYEGEPLTADFSFEVPASVTEGHYECSLAVLQDRKGGEKGVAVDKVHFSIRVGAVATREQALPVVRQGALEVGRSARGMAEGISLIKMAAALGDFVGEVGRQLLRPVALCRRNAQSSTKLAEFIVPLVAQAGDGGAAAERRELAAAALAVLARTPAHCDAIMAAGGLAVLVDLATAGSPKARAQALAAVEQLAYGSALAAAALLLLALAATAAAAAAAGGKACAAAEPARPLPEAVKQLGTACRSNNAGDGPEKTRAGRDGLGCRWFPRFKSVALSSFRGPASFACCLCALPEAERTKRFKPEKLQHCACGRDQWAMAKQVEDAEYKRRKAVLKQMGVATYAEALALGAASAGVAAPAAAVMPVPVPTPRTLEDAAAAAPPAKRMRSSDAEELERLRAENDRLARLLREQQAAALAQSPPSPPSETETDCSGSPTSGGSSPPPAAAAFDAEWAMIADFEFEDLLAAPMDSWLEPAPCDAGAEAELLSLFAD